MENGYIISGDKSMLDIGRVCELLSGCYWAKDRSREAIRRSIENSMCFGVYKDGEQVGFARAVTDNATIYWLCDVIIDDKHRGLGLGKRLVEYIVNACELAGLRGILATKDAHGLYEQYGFTKNPDKYMERPAKL